MLSWPNMPLWLTLFKSSPDFAFDFPLILTKVIIAEITFCKFGKNKDHCVCNMHYLSLSIRIQILTWTNKVQVVNIYRLCINSLNITARPSPVTRIHMFIAWGGTKKVERFWVVHLIFCLFKLFNSLHIGINSFGWASASTYFCNVAIVKSSLASVFEKLINYCIQRTTARG